jgi:hypothetical protein
MQWYAFARIQFGFRPAGGLEASGDLQESRKHHEAVVIEQVAMST